MWQLGHEVVHSADGNGSLQNLQHGKGQLVRQSLTESQLPERHAASIAKPEAAVLNASASFQAHGKPQVTTATRAKQAAPEQA